MHVNVDFPRLQSSIVASDHEPVLARIRFDAIDALGLRGEVYGSKALEIFWNRLPGASRYRVSRNSELVLETQGISFFESALEGGTSYEYSVVAVDSAGSELASGSVTLKTRPGVTSQPTAVISLLEGAVYSSSAVEIFWQLSESVTGIKGFDVKRDGVLVDSNDGRSFFEEGLSPSTKYVYEVTAFDDSGSVGAPVAVELMTRSGNPGSGVSGPPKVSELTGLVYSSSAVEIFWQMPETDIQIASYEVLRNDELILTDDVRSKFDSDLASATEFTYGVRAVDSNGNRGELSTVVLKTLGRSVQ